MSATDRPRLALLDGHGIIFRAFFAQKDNPLSVRRTGELTSAVFGFANTLPYVAGDMKSTGHAITPNWRPDAHL